ncbi:MAG: glycosyltransferase family 39 protein [Terriglobales bacterium]
MKPEPLISDEPGDHNASNGIGIIEPQSPNASSPGNQPWAHLLLHWHFVVLLAVIVFFGAIRWRLLDMPLERDEGEYAYAGQLILQGIPPYQLAYNMKLPGTYAAYAGIMAAFGQTARGIHLGLLLVNSVCVILLYLIAARLFGSLAGLIAGASYGLLSTHQGVLGFAAHATHFVVLWALMGILLLWQAEETDRVAFLFSSGSAFGVAFLMKQPGILFGAFAFCYLAVQCWPKNDHGWALLTKKLGIFLLGAAVPFAVTCALLYRAGVFQAFWFWTFDYARQYGAIESLSQGWHFLSDNFSYLLRFAPWLWILAAVGVASVFWDATVRRYAVFIFGLLGFSCAAVSLGLYFRPHYFVLMMPAVAILIAIAATSSIRLLAGKYTSRWIHILPAIAFIAAWGLAVQRNADFYFRLTPVQASRMCYPSYPFAEALPIADYLRQHTGPTDNIMVLGSEPEIYFYAQRHSASGYIYTYSLLEDQAYWQVMQKQIEQEVEARQPAYVVFVNVFNSWGGKLDSPQAAALSSWMDRYVAYSFEQVGIAELSYPDPRYANGFSDAVTVERDTQGPLYFWGDEAQGHRRPFFEVRIFKRKD